MYNIHSTADSEQSTLQSPVYPSTRVWNLKFSIIELHWAVGGNFSFQNWGIKNLLCLGQCSQCYSIACAAESNTLLNPLLVGSPNSNCWGNKLKTHHRHHNILQFSVNQFPSVVNLFAVMCFWLMTPASEAGVTKTWCRSWYLDPPSVSSRSRMQRLLY